MNRGWAHQWNDGEALQVIGHIKGVATSKGAIVVLQEPASLPMAAQQIGFPYNPKKHINDEISAMLHGSFYLFKEYGPDATTTPSGGSGAPSSSGVRRPTRVAQISSYTGLSKARRKAGMEVPKQEM